MPYKHNFSYGSDWDVTVFHAVKSPKRKHNAYQIDIIEPFPDHFTSEQKFEILDNVIKLCKKERRRIERNEHFNSNEFREEYEMVTLRKR